MSAANNHLDLKDQQIRDLQARLKQAERERDELLRDNADAAIGIGQLRGENKAFRDALRPFAETYREMQRNGWTDAAFAQFGTTGRNFARAADLVPATETPKPDAVKAPG
jgi:chromosome segregation ATPase